MFSKVIYRKFVSPAIHLMFWLILILMPMIMFYNREINIIRLIEHSWIPLIFVAIIFYVNYLYFLDKYFFQRKYVQFILGNLFLMLVLVLSNDVVRDYFFEYGRQVFGDDMHKNPRPKPSALFFIIKDVSSFFISLIFAIAIKALQRWFQVEKDRQDYENQKLNSELQHLRYQIQPHFFFNSLNNIYSLVEISPTDAQKSIHNLSKLMRYMLYEAVDQEVDLKKEIDFLKQYIEIMALRLGSKVKVTYNFPQLESGDYQISPLLFIPLIENAYKHGISPTESSVIEFEMQLKNNWLTFKSVNSFFPKPDSDKSGSGIGLDNLKKRLQLLHPTQHLVKQEIKDGFFKIVIELPVMKGEADA